jgi:hypothetical protein
MEIGLFLEGKWFEIGCNESRPEIIIGSGGVVGRTMFEWPYV